MTSTGTEPTAVAPPAGTGNAPGLGEAFSVDLNSGQGRYSVPLPLPDGVAGWQPQLNLEYGSQYGNGPFGYGWQIPLRQIQYRLDYGVPAEELTERFMDSGAELVHVGSGEYRARFEATFTTYRRQGEGWMVFERDGTRHELGMTPAGRIADPDDPARIVTWLLERSLDTSGNAIDYEYIQNKGQPYLSSIRYASYTIRFHYQPRPDQPINGRAGFLRQLKWRCHLIQLFAKLPSGDRAMRSWALEYRSAPYSRISMLASLQLTSHGAAPDRSQDVVRRPQRFTYGEIDLSTLRAAFMDTEPGAPLPPGLNDPDVTLTLLDDAPLPGVLQVKNGRHFYWPNEGNGRWGYPRVLKNTPRVASLRHDGVQLLDMDGNASIDMLVGLGGHTLTGYYENGGRDGWKRFVAYPRAQRTMPPFKSGRVRLGDMDGDGVVDALYSGGRLYATYRNQATDGWATPTVSTVSDGESGPDVQLDDASVRLVDMTGDGLPDLVRIRSGRVEYWPNLGHGRFGRRVVMSDAPRIGALKHPEQILLVDVDGDGTADLVVVDHHGIQVFFNQTGQGWSEGIFNEVIPPPIPGTLRPANMLGKSGSGLVWNSPRSGRTAYVHCELGAQVPPYHLSEVENGAGLQGRIVYRSAVVDALRDRSQATPWDTYLPFPVTVVAATRETDLVTRQTAESRYEYHQGHFDAHHRQFEGFAQVDKYEVGDSSRPDGLIRFFFRMNEDQKPGNGLEYAALNRMQYRTEVYGLDGSSLADKPYHVEETDHRLQVLDSNPDGQQRVWVTVHTTRQRYLERGADERVEEKTYTYDSDGNVVVEAWRAFGTEEGAAQPELKRTTEITYAKNTAANILDRPARIVRRDGNGNLVAELHRFYDGSDYTGLPFGQVSAGRLTRESQWVLKKPQFDAHYSGMDTGGLGYFQGVDADQDEAVFVAKKRYKYNPAGVVTGELSPLGVEKSYGYDDTNLFRVLQQGPLGSAQTDFDPVVGKPVRIVEADGTTIEMAYDAQGRITAVALPGDTLLLPSRSYIYDDTALPHAIRISYRQRHGAAEALESAVYFDGRMQEIQRRTLHDAGKVIVSGWRQRNPWSDVCAEYEPFFDIGLDFALPDVTGLPCRRVFYDSEGRPVRTENYNDGVSSVSFTPFSIVSYDANDNDSGFGGSTSGPTPRRELLDAGRNRIGVVEDAGDGQSVITRFDVNAMGLLLAQHDIHGEVARYTIDGLGKRLRIQHREAGERLLWHDAQGRVVQTLDAKGDTVFAEFDDADRIATLQVNGAVHERYTYDNAAVNAMGRLYEVTYPGGRQQFNYNFRGQIADHHFFFDGHAAPYSFHFAYNALGKQEFVEYPDGSVVQYEYYDNGMPRRIPGIVDGVDYNARMLPERLVHANGVTTTISYEHGPGHVARQKTVNGLNQVLEDQAFAYSPTMQIQQIHDQGPGSQGTVDYLYNPLGQLTQTTDNRFGVVDLWEYEYINGRSLARHGESQTQLLYDDALHPSRVSRIAVAGQPSTAVGFDANGNIINLPGRTFSFNPKGDLVRVDRENGTGADYEYDYLGHRVRKRVSSFSGPVTETLFFNKLAEIRDGELYRFVQLGKVRVALLHDDQTRWIHTNYLGSETFFTDAMGSRIAQIAYTPFGNVRQRNGTAQQVFALHEWDEETGLYYMHRRYYAAELGQFVSPDGLYLYRPEKGVDDPRRLGLYLYVAGDPVNNLDPHGRSFWSVFGAIVGVIVGIVVAVAVIAAFATGIGWGLLAVVAVIGFLVAGYALASATAGTDFGEFMRGFMIGFNAGMNATLLAAMGPVGVVLGVIVGVINFLAAIDTIAQSEIYQGILGWSNWLMPMSWLVVAIGVVFFVLNLLGHAITFGQVEEMRVERIFVDWSTGTIFMRGGWISNLNSWNTAFNMGNFAFIDRLSPTDHVDHEAGHTLSLAAFGSIFHFIGFFDEVVVGNGGGAYAERIADSNDPGTTPDPDLPMWV